MHKIAEKMHLRKPSDAPEALNVEEKHRAGGPASERRAQVQNRER
jgi:hypothetical protein